MAAPLEPGENQILLNGKLYNLNVKRSPQDIVRQDLQTFPAPATIGPADYNTDPVTAVWVMSDFTGGMGVEDITGSDTTRYRWGTADARSPGNITLGPYVLQTRPTSDNADNFYPLGDVPGNTGEFYAQVYDDSAGNVPYYAWDEQNDTWRASGGTLLGLGFPGVRYRGNSGSNQLFFASLSGSRGYTSDVAGTLITMTTPTIGAGSQAKMFAVWDGRMWTLDENNTLYYSFGGGTWVVVTDPRTGGDLSLEPSTAAWKLISWYNLAGESTLYALSERILYALNLGRGAFEHVYDIPPHPLGARCAAVWRPTEDLWIGVGGSIIRRTPAGVSVPLAGPGADADGLPSGFIGRIQDMVAEFNALYCMIVPSTTAGQKGSVLRYTGNGWHPIWESSTANQTFGYFYVSADSGAYRLWWGEESYGYTIELDDAPFSPRQGYAAGVSKFAASSYLETGRFWGQTQGFYKLAHRLEVFMDHATSTEKVTVYYQTDTVTSWTQLGSAVTTGRDTVPASPFTALYFGTADANGIYPGIRFNWIKFKFEFARGGTVTNTPVMAAAAFHFIKLRDSTPSVTVDLDFTEDIGGRTPGQQKAELRALANSASQFYTLREGMNVYGVVVASFVDYGASGADQRGNGSLSIIAVQATQVA